MQLEIPVTVYRLAIVVACVLALGGCVSSAYRYDDDPGVYYRSSAGYPPYYYGYPGYYRYPGYYAPPRQYRHAPYPPRVVYYDHDHRDDDGRHQSHRHREERGDSDRHDRGLHDGDRRDRKRQEDRQEHRPAAESRTPPPPVRQPPPVQHSGGMRSPRVQQPKEAVTSPQARKEAE